MTSSVERVEFVRQLYNLRDLLENNSEAEDINAKIEELQNRIDQHVRMRAFNTKDLTVSNPVSHDSPRSKRKHLDGNVRDWGAGGAGDAIATAGVALGARGYEAERDESGFGELILNVR